MLEVAREAQNVCAKYAKAVAFKKEALCHAYEKLTILFLFSH